MKNAPWWLISAGIHLVLLLGAALVFIETIYPLDDTSYVLLSPRSAMIDGGQGHWPKVPDRLTNSTKPEDEPAVFESQTFERFLEREERLRFQDCQGPGRLLRNPDPASPERFFEREQEAPRFIRGGVLRARIESWCRNYGTFRPTAANTPSDSAVLAALRWLARHQNPDGSWSAAGFGRRCPKGLCGGPGDADYDTGVTSLAVLAFLGAGFSHLSKADFVDPAFPGQTLRFGDTVKRGLQWLLSQQDPTGAVGPPVSKRLYNHAIATFALSEAYGMTASTPLQAPAQKAVDFLIAAQNPGSGWRYSPRCGDNDTSVTGWAVMALKSAEMSGLRFPRSAYDGALGWVAEATDSDRVGYNRAGTGKVFIPGFRENYADHPTMTAIGLLSRLFIQKHHRNIRPAAVALLTTDPPVWKAGHVDFYYWYYGSLALFQYDQELWGKWYEPLKIELVEHQKNSGHGCENGSWDPSADRWGSEGGRVYATAINALSMEVYYIYPTSFRSR